MSFYYEMTLTDIRWIASKHTIIYANWVLGIRNSFERKSRYLIMKACKMQRKIAFSLLGGCTDIL